MIYLFTRKYNMINTSMIFMRKHTHALDIHKRQLKLLYMFN